MCTTLNETLDGPEPALGGQQTDEQVTAFMQRLSSSSDRVGDRCDVP
jgi:hypothetical protein